MVSANVSQPPQEPRRPLRVTEPVQPPVFTQVSTRGAPLRRLPMSFEADFILVPACGTRGGTFSRVSAAPEGKVKNQLLSSSLGRSSGRSAAETYPTGPWRLEKVSWPFVLRADCLVPTCGGEETEVGTFLFGFVLRARASPQYCTSNDLRQIKAACASVYRIGH